MHTKHAMRAAVVVGSMLAYACGSDYTPTARDVDFCHAGDCTGEAITIDTGLPTFMAPADDGWASLVEVDWELAAGTEGYRCVTLTVPRDVHLHAIAPELSEGTRRMMLSVRERAEEPDGVRACDAFTHGPRLIASAGPGLGETVLPQGVTIPLHAGEQLVLNAYVYNDGHATMQGYGSARVRSADETATPQQADVLLAGPTDLSIRPGGGIERGQCTLREASTLIAVQPQMRQLGRHMRVIAHSSLQGQVAMFDARVDPGQPGPIALQPIEMRAGDVVEVECEFDNPTDHTVAFGEHSVNETCFAGLLRYTTSADYQGPFCTL